MKVAGTDHEMVMILMELEKLQREVEMVGNRWALSWSTMMDIVPMYTGSLCVRTNLSSAGGAVDLEYSVLSPQVRPCSLLLYRFSLFPYLYT